MKALEAGRVPGVVMVSGLPVLTAVVQAEFEYTSYVTVPVAVAAFVPERVAVSVTAVLGATAMFRPVWPPPEREVESVDEVSATSVSDPHGLTDGALRESPEYDACQ